MAEQPVVKKKVDPYPIDANVTGGTGNFIGKIVKLTKVGFLIDIGDKWVNVMEDYQVSFIIPVLGRSIQSPVKVIKTYDQYNKSGGGVSKVGAHLAEMHFIKLPDNHRDAIHRFLVAIKQIPG